MRKNYFMLIVVSCLAVVGSGCFATKDTNHPASYNKDEEYQLTIAHSRVSLFEKRYGEWLRDGYSNVQLRVIDDGLVISPDLGAWMDQMQPDIIFIPSEQEYRRLVESNYLVELEQLIERDQYDLDGYISSVIDRLRLNVHGKLYGLAPNFFNTALFYNQTIFDELNMIYPEDSMTWFQILELAIELKTNQANSERHVISFHNYFRTPAHLILEIGRTEGLQYWDEHNQSVTLNTNLWQAIWELVKRGYHHGAIEDTEQLDHLSEDVAMYIGNYIHYRQLLSQQQQDWGLATLPMNPIQLHGIIAISSQTANQEVAWEIVKYLNGDEVAQYEANSPMDLGFSSREKWIRTMEELPSQAFYEGDSNINASVSDEVTISLDVQQQIIQIMNEEFDRYLHGDQDVSETLSNTEARVQQII